MLSAADHQVLLVAKLETLQVPKELMEPKDPVEEHCLELGEILSSFSVSPIVFYL
jgi:hypothetical protein